MVLLHVSLVDNMPSFDAMKPSNTEEAPSDITVEMDMLESPLVLDAAVEDEIEKIVKCLEEIARVLADPDAIIVRRTFRYLLIFLHCATCGIPLI